MKITNCMKFKTRWTFIPDQNRCVSYLDCDVNDDDVLGDPSSFGTSDECTSTCVFDQEIAAARSLMSLAATSDAQVIVNAF